MYIIEELDRNIPAYYKETICVKPDRIWGVCSCGSTEYDLEGQIAEAGDHQERTSCFYWIKSLNLPASEEFSLVHAIYQIGR